MGLKGAEEQMFLTVATYKDEVRATAHNGLGVVRKGYVLIPMDGTTRQDWLSDKVVELASQNDAETLMLEGVLPAGADYCGHCGEREFRTSDVGSLVHAEPSSFPVEVLTQDDGLDPGECEVLIRNPADGCVLCGTRKIRKLLLIVCNLLVDDHRLFVGVICAKCLFKRLQGRCPYCEGGPDEVAGEDHILLPYQDGLIKEFVQGVMVGGAEAQPAIIHGAGGTASTTAAL